MENWLLGRQGQDQGNRGHADHRHGNHTLYNEGPVQTDLTLQNDNFFSEQWKNVVGHQVNT